MSSYPWASRSPPAPRPVRARPIPATTPGPQTPYVDGVVLIGDAAGHNDPIIGQGLSIALRDARIVRDLVLDGARTAATSPPTEPNAWVAWLASGSPRT